MRPDLPIRLGLSVEAVAPELTGIGRYSLELARRLPEHPAIQSLTCFRGSSVVGDLEELRVSGVLRRRSPRFRKLSELLARSRIDLMHGPNYFLPDWAERGVVTIHDLSVFRFPDLHPTERVAAFEKSLRRSIDRASHLITDCTTIRNEVIGFTGVSPDRVTAIPIGIDATFQPLAETARSAALKRLGVPTSGYGLTVSSLEPRKRIDRLIHAWRLLPPSLRERYPLVIAGASGWNNDKLHNDLQQAVREGWAILLGFVDESDLPALYSGASLFVFPSMYEGFGLPPLEAMASGVPTVVARGSCLEEVTAGAAMLAEPQDEGEFAETIARALTDDGWRTKAVSSGIQVAKGYTWDRCVDETVGVYQQVIGGATGG